VAARHGGAYAVHLRDEMAALDAITAADEPTRPGCRWSSPTTNAPAARSGGRSLQTLAPDRAPEPAPGAGLDVYPYLAGSTVLREDLADGLTPIRLTWSEARPELAGRWLADIARLGCSEPRLSRGCNRAVPVTSRCAMPTWTAS
jgi:N-acyl-D-amino-acid deacylase